MFTRQSPRFPPAASSFAVMDAEQRPSTFLAASPFIQDVLFDGWKESHVQHAIVKDKIIEI